MDINYKKNKNLEPLYIKGHYAEKKKYMPQKSTWFHPKPLDGLISSKIIITFL